MLTLLILQDTNHGQTTAVKVFQRSLPPPFPSYGRAFANPLLGTSAIMCSPTPNSGPLKYMNHRRKKRRTCRFCASLSLFMGHSGTYEKIICFHMFPLVRTYEWTVVCVTDGELEGCVGRSILCWCKLISRIQMLGVLCRQEMCASEPIYERR